MFNKKYKKGMADASKAYEAFGQKQTDAIKHILEEVRQGKRDLESVLRELNGNIDGLYDYIDSKEKANLYTVYTPFDIKELDQQARLFLVGALIRLTVDRAPNENQQNYIRAIQKYLEIKDPPFGVDPEAVANIDGSATNKAILQAVLEYLRLQEGDSYDETELQQNFLDAFNLNTKTRKEITEHVELLYTATGAKGLAEKYGYVPEEEPNVKEDEDTRDGSDQTGTTYAVSPEEEKNIDIFVGAIGPIGHNMIETTNYLLGSETSSWFRLDKSSGEKTTYKMDKLGIYSIENRSSTILGDTVYFEYDHTLTALDVSIMQKTSVAPIPSYIKSLSAYNDKVVFVGGNDKGYIYDITTRKCLEIPGVSDCWSVFAVQSGIYFISDGTLKFYNCKTKEITIVVENISSHSHEKLLYCSQSGVFYILESGAYGSNTGFRRVCLPAGHSIGYQRYSLMEHLGSVIHPYKDCLIFVAPGGRITRVDYETGETIVLTDDATSHHHLDGGLFRKSSSWDEPVEFNRVGNYIYYFANGDYSRVCKLSITNPNEKEVFSRDYESFREGIIEKT